MRSLHAAVNRLARVISEFEQATSSTLRDGLPGRFEGQVAPGWDIGGNANGGYLLAIAGRAMAQVTQRPPLTITAHYLAPAPAGPCTVDVELVRSGRRMATATASLRQGDREVIRVLGTFADQAGADQTGADQTGADQTGADQTGADQIAPPLLVDGGPPDLPEYHSCVMPPSGSEGPLPALNDRLAVRLRPGDDGFRRGAPTGVAEIAGWFAFADAQPIDAIALLLVADAFAPPVFNTELPVAWVPTLELTVHVRGTPAPGPLRCAFASRFIHGGLLEEDGEIWDSRGVLVAQSRQLALIPRE
jgi:acyl-coenzyme A thioesterase PaaI-like protein